MEWREYEYLSPGELWSKIRSIIQHFDDEDDDDDDNDNHDDDDDNDDDDDADWSMIMLFRN